MLKDKRGFEITAENVIGIVLALLVIFIIAPKAFGFANAFLFGKSDKLNQATSQIEDLILELDGLKNSEMTYPLYIPYDWFLIKFDKNNPDIPEECTGKNCLCICPAKKFAGLIPMGFNCNKGVCKPVEKEVKMEISIKIPSDITLKSNDIIEIIGTGKPKTTKTTELSEEENQKAKTFDDYLKEKYPDLWVAGLGDCIVKAEKEFGVPKEVILAVALHESGRGTSGLSKSSCISNDGSEYSNNLFGITTGSGLGTAGKCNWPTWECYTEKETGKNAVLEGATCTESNIKSCQSKGKNCYSLNRYFRAYNKKCDSVEDFARMISTSPKYQKAMENKGNIELMINSMLNTGYYKCGADGKQECQYATDPAWAEQVFEIAQSVQKEEGASA